MDTCQIPLVSFEVGRLHEAMYQSTSWINPPYTSNPFNRTYYSAGIPTKSLVVAASARESTQRIPDVGKLPCLHLPFPFRDVKALHTQGIQGKYVLDIWTFKGLPYDGFGVCVYHHHDTCILWDSTCRLTRFPGLGYQALVLAESSERKLRRKKVS